jgi:hypothetical protein
MQGWGTLLAVVAALAIAIVNLIVDGRRRESDRRRDDKLREHERMEAEQRLLEEREAADRRLQEHLEEQREQRRQAQLHRARQVYLSTFTVPHHQDSALTPFARLLTDMQNTGESTWPSTCLRIENRGSSPITDLTVRFGSVLALYGWAMGDVALGSGSSWPYLAPQGTACFARPGLSRENLAAHAPTVEFTDEDGQRWLIDLRRHVTRLDKAEDTLSDYREDWKP